MTTTIVGDPDPSIRLPSGAVLTTHVAESDPHTQYQKESEKDAASGYAGLSAGSKLAGAQQTYGTGANTACVGNDARLTDSRAPNGAAGGVLAGTYPNPSFVAEAAATAAGAAVVTTAAALTSYGYTEAQANDVIAQLNLTTARLNDLVTKLTTRGLLSP